jgi:hypothetical protein
LDYCQIEVFSLFRIFRHGRIRRMVAKGGRYSDFELPASCNAACGRAAALGRSASMAETFFVFH